MARPSRLRQALDLLRRPTRRVAYGADRSQRADLYLPAGPGSHPVAILLHGGFWRAKYSKRLMRLQAADLVRHGWAAWNVEYRRLGRGGGWPATFEDVAAAIDLLPGLDARLDLERVAAIGHSAGGELALWAAARAGLPGGAPGEQPRVFIERVVAQGAVLDMVKTARAIDGGAVHEVLGGSPEQVPERYAQADPTQRLPLGLPVLLVHGDADGTVPIRRARAYADAARAAGDEVELVEIAGGGHRGHIDTRTRDWAVALDWLRSWS